MDDDCWRSTIAIGAPSLLESARFMTALSIVATAIREIVASRAARPLDGDTDDVPLGSNGLGLDSIAIAEVLLECERRFDVRLTDLLDAPVTVRRIVARVEQSSES